MTLIAVFGDFQSTQLISDSLLTRTNENEVNVSENAWLSTGILIDDSDQLRYKFIEGYLKIWQIQSNMAIALAGDLRLSISVLELIADYSKHTRITSFDDLNQLLVEQIIKSISPIRESCVFCGFIDCNGETTKFKITIAEPIGITVEHSTDPSIFYVAGTGENDFLEIWKRLPKDYLEANGNPGSIISTFAEQLYLKQFLGEKEIITERFTGGSIVGVYIKDGNLYWQPSRAILIFVNIGGTGFNINFKWLPLVYKTWYENGSLFSSSMFEKNGIFYQRITHNANSLSEPISFSENNLLTEMKTFNASSYINILLSKGMTTEKIAILPYTGTGEAFDELYENGKVKALRVNKEYLKYISNEIFVSNDFTINMWLDKYDPLIKEIRNKLCNYSRRENSRKWIELKQYLAETLLIYGLYTKNLDILSESLHEYLDAFKTASTSCPDLLDATSHRVRIFTNELRNNKLNEKQIFTVIHKYKDKLKIYGFSES